MKEALVIHCKLSVYAGAEYLCLYTCRILQDTGYHVNLVSDVFDPSKVERLYGMGKVLSKCTHIRMPEPRSMLPSKLLALERLLYAVRLARFANSLSRMDFAIVLSTQSSIFHFPGKRLYHFVYEVADLFCYPMPLVRGALPRGKRAKGAYFALLRTLYSALAGSPTPLWYFVTGHGVLQRLRQMGYHNSSFFCPPSRVFKTKLPKEKRIVQACRIAPEKRLEFLFETARRLPHYNFYLAGKNLPAHIQSNPGYAERLLAKLPPNVTYVETLIHDRPELLEESKVYFHTGLERGILLILMEAMSAGCILVVPEAGVAGEVVRAAGVGYTYRTMEEAVEKLKIAMDGQSPWTPYEISERARQLGPEGFEGMIRKLVGESAERYAAATFHSG